MAHLAPLLAAVPAGALALAGAVCAGLLAGWMGYVTVRTVTSRRPDELLPTDLERDRRRLLRRRSAAYRWFEPVVGPVGTALRSVAPEAVARLSRDLHLVEPPAPRAPAERWEPVEYLAVKQIEAAVLGIGAGAVFATILGIEAGILIAVLFAAAGPWLLIGSVRTRAAAYRAQVRARLPMAIDLMALMLEANATLIRCVEAVASENAGHPIGDLFGVLADSIRRSVPQDEALRRMADLIDDPDVNELVFTLTATGQTSGLRAILKSMSGPMRTRRVQELERASEQAKVNITFPGMIIMVGCLLIVLALFVLPAGQP